MGAISVSSSIVGECAPRLSCQIQLRHGCMHRSQKFLPCYERLQMKCYVLPRLSRSACSAIRTRRLSFGAVESRPLGLVSVRTFVVRAQKEGKEQQEVGKVEEKSPESWTSSVQRARTVSRIFVATFVWMSLFFGISVANNEMSGGRPGRRGPRK